MCLHEGILESNPDSDHLIHVDCEPDSNLDLGPDARVNGHGANCVVPKTLFDLR